VKFFPKLGLLDFPERYGKSREKIPYPGGITLVLLILAILLWQKLYILSGLTVILAGISFWDDRQNIAIFSRLLVQLLTAIIFAFFVSKIEFIGNPFGEGSFKLGQNLAIFATVIWIIAIQNAMNWFDGLKGLCVGVSGIGFLALGIFGLVRPEVLWETDLPVSLAITFSIAGILLGVWVAFFRGKILLGDTGSQVIGFLLAGFSIIAGTKIATTLLILGLPILDLILVIGRRIFIDKKSPFKGDLKHLHHLI
jgi:UDP-GlcNAc:undecaprenyl-phosphate GlcNAc-1-phosphate transferase